MTQLITDKESNSKEYHRNKLFELSLKSLGEIPQLDKLNDEQKDWVKRRLSGPSLSWEVWHAK